MSKNCRGEPIVAGRSYPAARVVIDEDDAEDPHPRGKLVQTGRCIAAAVIDQCFAIDLRHDQPLGFSPSVRASQYAMRAATSANASSVVVVSTQAVDELPGFLCAAIIASVIATTILSARVGAGGASAALMIVLLMLLGGGRPILEGP